MKQSKRQIIQEEIFDKPTSKLTVADVLKAITDEGGLALCKSTYPPFIKRNNKSPWYLTQPDIFFPDDDYVTVPKRIANQIIKQDDICQQTLDGITIYRRA